MDKPRLSKLYLLTPTVMSKLLEKFLSEEPLRKKNITRQLPSTSKDSFYTWKEVQQKLQPKLIQNLLKSRKLVENDVHDMFREVNIPSSSSNVHQKKIDMHHNYNDRPHPHRPMKLEKEEKMDSNASQKFDINNMSISDIAEMYNLNKTPITQRVLDEDANIEISTINQNEENETQNDEENREGAHALPPVEYNYSPVSGHTRKQMLKRQFQTLSPLPSGQTPYSKKSKKSITYKNLIKDIQWKPYDQYK